MKINTARIYHKEVQRTKVCMAFKITFFIVAILIFSCFAMASPKPLNAGQPAVWRFPAEFEKQDTVWVGWLTKQSIKGHETDPVFLNIVKALVPRVKVCICVPDAAQKQHVEDLLNKNSIPLGNVSFYKIPFTMPYWRDFGPIFTVAEGTRTMSIADFSFNFWNYLPEYHAESRMLERIDRTVAKSMGIPSRMTRLVSEGGDRELNGKGTIMLTEACEFSRNPNISRKEIEAELTEMLGVNNFIWLKKGTVDDDAYNTSTLPGPGGNGVAYRSASAINHIDEYCRFVTPNTILLAEVTEAEAAKGPVERENRRRMEENYEILKKAKDQDGRPFKIIRIPMPETQYFTADPNDEIYANLASTGNFTDGTRFPYGESVKVVPAQSYCNFLISNGVVLAQKYWKKGLPDSVRKKDEAALKVLKEVFPNREVIAIDTVALNFVGGGIHCATQQQPSF